MKRIIIVLVLVTMVLFSCRQGSKASSDTVDTKKNIQDKKRLAHNDDKNIYSKYNYIDSKGTGLIIQNSVPKGGMKYKDSKGNEYVFAVFWTRIINEMSNPVELKIDFPLNSYEIPDLPGEYYKVLIPSDTMTIDKIPLFNYGLKDLDFFDKNIDKPSSLKRIIDPKSATGFYVVTLRLVGGTHYGIVRTELTLKGQNVFYKIRDKEIKCGSIAIKETP